VSLFNRPKILYPTLIKGIISGPIRCESIDGTELWLPRRNGILRMEPFTADGKMFCVSHIQKKSKFFQLLYDPFIFHSGAFWHLQEQDPDGSWKAGTERGIYWRTPGWRWQIPDAVSDWTPWIFSGGRFFGGHLD